MNEEEQLPDILPFYDCYGRAICYLYDGEYFYLYGGKPVAFLYNDEHVYSFGGRWLGWFQNGWLWDRSGKAAFFCELASGGPARPARQTRPARGARHARPARAAREARPARPARTIAWSTLSDESFFG